MTQLHGDQGPAGRKKLGSLGATLEPGLGSVSPSSRPVESVPRAPRGCGLIPRAAVTRHPQLGVLKQQKVFSHNSGG